MPRKKTPLVALKAPRPAPPRKRPNAAANRFKDFWGD